MRKVKLYPENYFGIAVLLGIVIWLIIIGGSYLAFG